MAPKRRSTRGPPPSTAPAPKRSKLAKENQITNEQEAEIREAFSLFSLRSNEGDQEDGEGVDDVLGAGRRRRRGGGKGKEKAGEEAEEESVLRRGDVRRCLIALNIGPKPSELTDLFDTLDPTETGYIHFMPFLSYASLLLNKYADDADEDDDDDKYGQKSSRNEAEVNEAYALFTHNAPGPITLNHLRRVAKELREDVPDQLLKDMVLEANGGVGDGDLRRGVGREEFEGVMKRAGVFG